MDIIINHYHDTSNNTSDRGIKDLPLSHEDIVHDNSHDPGYKDTNKHDPGNYDNGTHDPGKIDTGCVPNCTDKECGSNGCGGNCGKCTGTDECIANKCICIPDCANKKCGDNGCGGKCGTCDADSQCIEGEWKCAVYGPCEGKNKIFCYTPNDPNGNYNSVSNNNGWSGNSDKIDLYTCPGPDTAMASGPEVVYEFDAPQTGSVTLNFSPNANYLNAYILQGSCNGKMCKYRTHNTQTFAVSKGDTWYIVVDATGNRTAGYSMHLDCSWTPSN